MDPTGAVIRGADVVLKNTSQQFSRQAVTESHGEYVILAIPPGNYEPFGNTVCPNQDVSRFRKRRRNRLRHRRAIKNH